MFAHSSGETHTSKLPTKKRTDHTLSVYECSRSRSQVSHMLPPHPHKIITHAEHEHDTPGSSFMKLLDRCQEAAPILKQYLLNVAVVQPYFDATRDSPLEAFEREVPRHPVFRITPMESQRKEHSMKDAL